MKKIPGMIEASYYRQMCLLSAWVGNSRRVANEPALLDHTEKESGKLMWAGNSKNSG